MRNASFKAHACLRRKGQHRFRSIRGAGRSKTKEGVERLYRGLAGDRCPMMMTIEAMQVKGQTSGDKRCFLVLLLL